ncbi:RNA polymerase sigma-70 factor (ECF subfamily) [Methylopila capsulata]|uniref:RNA polymerase sigma-70 factor (ECF subfamily) n=2 Tax=Methylopila capsulata TaxID=61654 RepID=A0A9W6MSA1_9HYPH|nr:RNA polymerase sigma factor [Methylopila capsulata]MBM7852366.1 RNA polymerase sigma-70 factor (ECF subfamily) [Methylopila capsulata]GLK56575.1 siderophore-interacting protein [Methylopila capsulata]
MTTLTGAPTSFEAGDGRDLLNRAIEAHYEEMIAAARRGGRTRSAALDVVHDVYLKLAARPELLADKRSLGAFLRRAAANLGVDRLRRERFESRLFSGADDEAAGVAAASPALEHALDAERRVALLQRAIAELPPRRRAVFVLHRLHGLSTSEIADRLNLTRNMVDRHLRRSFTHCLDRLAEFD